MKWLSGVLVFCAIFCEYSNGQVVGPGEDPLVGEVEQALNLAIVNVIDLEAEFTADGISADASYKATAGDQAVDVLYSLGISGWFDGDGGLAILTSTGGGGDGDEGIKHHNIGDFQLAEEATVTWSSSIANALAPEHYAFYVMADVTATDMTTGVVEDEDKKSGLMRKGAGGD